MKTKSYKKKKILFIVILNLELYIILIFLENAFQMSVINEISNDGS